LRCAARLAAAVACMISAPPALGAWAICNREIVSEPAIAKTELEAKRLALADWTEKARRDGEAFTRWQLAWNRRLTCEPADSGLYQCTALGRPCRISQTPPAPGSERLKP
jgi:hypothetical protein